ncbi:MAG: hypothetical protein ACREOU_06170 [Candidatus Eiseniibacteriota bacterium]
MIRFATHALLAIAAVCLLSPNPARAQGERTGTNLLSNPGFEAGGLFSPSDWDSTLAGVPTVMFYWDPEVKRSGTRSACVVNAGDHLPVWHNWNQMILHAGRFAGRDLELSAWVRSAQMGGRGYVMVQCYRDTVMNVARDRGIPRDQARTELGFKFADDPQLELGWARQYFSAELEEWTEKRVRVFVPPTTNLIVVRLGIFGSGQVWFDDIKLTSEVARASQAAPLGRNLLTNAGFEKPIDDWEFSLPPTPGAMISVDSTVAHSGRRSALMTTPEKPPFQTYMHACQVFNARGLAGKRVRMSGWCKLEGVNDASAYLSVWSTGLYGVDGSIAGDALFGTLDWTFYSVDFDVPKDTYTVWARAGYQSVPGRCWWDDLKFEVLGNTPTTGAGATSKPPGRKG